VIPPEIVTNDEDVAVIGSQLRVMLYSGAVVMTILFILVLVCTLHYFMLSMSHCWLLDSLPVLYLDLFVIVIILSAYPPFLVGMILSILLNITIFSAVLHHLYIARILPQTKVDFPLSSFPNPNFLLLMCCYLSQKATGMCPRVKSDSWKLISAPGMMLAETDKGHQAVSSHVLGNPSHGEFEL